MQRKTKQPKLHSYFTQSKATNKSNSGSNESFNESITKTSTKISLKTLPTSDVVTFTFV